MAQNNEKRSYKINDFLQHGKVKGTHSKTKVGYLQWLLKGGGWMRVGAVFGGLSLVGYIVFEVRDMKREENYAEARKLIQLGVRPVEEVNRNLLKSKQESQFGQSQMKDDKIK